jgi:hypothetical protein
MCLVVLKIYIYIYLYQIIKAKAFPWFGPSVRLLGFRPSVLLVFVVSYVVISPKYPDLTRVVLLTKLVFLVSYVVISRKVSDVTCSSHKGTGADTFSLFCLSESLNMRVIDCPTSDQAFQDARNVR